MSPLLSSPPSHSFSLTHESERDTIIVYIAVGIFLSTFIQTSIIFYSVKASQPPTAAITAASAQIKNMVCVCERVKKKNIQIVKIKLYIEDKVQQRSMKCLHFLDIIINREGRENFEMN